MIFKSQPDSLFSILLMRDADTFVAVVRLVRGLAGVVMLGSVATLMLDTREQRGQPRGVRRKHTWGWEHPVGPPQAVSNCPFDDPASHKAASAPPQAHKT